MPVALRAAGVEDARAVGEVFSRAFHAGFQGLLPAEVISEVGVAERRRAFDAQSLGDAAADYRTWVVVDDGVVVGFVDTRPCADLDAASAGVGPVGEIHALYLLPSHWGRGMGRALMNRALTDLRERGFSAATLWVLSTNRRARDFYVAAGMADDGARREVDVAGHALPHLRFRIALAPT